MSEGTIDVVIPLYNGERTILNTLNSVLVQTRPPDHIYVVNDGSTDRGPAFVRALGSPLVTVIDTPNKGVSHARNTGIKASGADYIAFLDADDLWLPQKLEKQLEVFSKNPKAMVVYCHSQSVSGSDDNTVIVDSRPKHKGNVFREVAFKGWIVPGSASSVAVSREVFDRVGYFDEHLAFGEDTDMWARVSEYFEFDYVSDPVVKTVLNPDSVTRNISFENARLIVIHSMRFREKIAKRYSDKDNVDRALFTIGLFVARYQVAPLSLARFLPEIRRNAPTLMRQIGTSNRLIVIKIYIAIFRFAVRYVRVRPIKRIRLFLSDGTMFFGKRSLRSVSRPNK